jgi:hypothetical protein
VSLRAGNETRDLAALWERHTLPGIRRNRREHARLIKDMRRVSMVTPAGLYLGEAWQARFEVDPVHRALRRVVRGLFFARFGQTLPADCTFSIELFDPALPGFDDWLAPILPFLTWEFVGSQSAFTYAFGRASDYRFDSVWLLTFYRSLFVCVFTTRPEPNRGVP